MSEDIARYRDIINEAGSGFDPNKILSHITRMDEDDVILNIPVNQPFWGPHITINSVTMNIGIVEDDGYFGDGDLAVNYTVNDAGSEEDEEPSMDPDDAMWIFYSDKGYDDELTHVLMDAGFSQEAASDIGGSEAVMQEEGRASYDAVGIADEVREAIEKVPASKLSDTIGRNILRNKGIDPSAGNIDSKKDQIIRWMLERIKEEAKLPFDVKVAATVLVNSNVKWPELNTILRT